jgi:2-polyprenyl-3-methyl-5-hydroxy-6-metoxy-1,4-benzoquinol methylase
MCEDEGMDNYQSGAQHELAQDWEAFGRKDPMWAVLSTPGMQGRWDPDAFFASGRAIIEELSGTLDGLSKTWRGGTALDFGTGLGRLAQPLAEHFDTVVGADIAYSMITGAQSLGVRDNVRYCLLRDEDLSQLPCAPYRLIISHITLQHIPPRLASSYLHQFIDLLEPGGHLVFTAPSHPAVTLKGLGYRILPRPIINLWKRKRDGSLMQMHPLRAHKIIEWATRRGLMLLRFDRSKSAGPNWIAYRYVFRRSY